MSTSYLLFQLTLLAADTIALLGLNLLTGYGGQISLGQGAFYGIGAYTTATLVSRGAVPFELTLPCAGGVCLVLGFLFGIPAARLEGLHLALATFALGVVFPQVLKCKALEDLTGGVQGIALPSTPAPFGLPLSPDVWLCTVAIGLALALRILARNLVRGHTGRAIAAIRDQPMAAAAAGIDTAFYKSLTFGLSAMYAGIAGGLAAMAVKFVSPDSFTIALSLGLLVGVVLGGLASIAGAFYGTLFLRFVPDLADEISKAAPTAVYGVILIVVALVMPRGVAGMVERLTRTIEGRIRLGHRTPSKEQP
ncbi:MAG TPA: branched-chain amino acid ABC transporter permease [Polyangiaceae bacterium]|nr:branched-chain amino acid ABC transporter permease [Polyangiaceae bacterium]